MFKRSLNYLCFCQYVWSYTGSRCTFTTLFGRLQSHKEQHSSASSRYEPCARPRKSGRSVQDGIYVLGPAHTPSIPYLRISPGVALETVPELVWLTMALFRSFKEDRRELPFLRASLLQAIDDVMSLCLSCTLQPRIDFRVLNLEPQVAIRVSLVLFNS